MMAEFEPLPLQQPPEQLPGLPLETVDHTLSPEVASRRATDASFSLKDKSQFTYEDYHQMFLQGKERDLREEIANKIDSQRLQQRQEALLAVYKAKGSSLSTEDVDQIDQRLSGRPDPRDVLEGEFSRKYMDHLNWPTQNPDQTSWLQGAYLQIPKEIERDINVGTDAVKTQSFFQTLDENANQLLSKQSWAGYIWDQAKNLTTIYPIARLHQTPVSWFNLPGHSMEEQAAYLTRLPYEEGKAKALEIYDRLKDDSTLLVQFTKSLLGQSTSERFINDVLPIAQPGLEVLAGAALYKALFRNATRDMVRSSATRDFPPDVAAALGAGNIEEAATRRATWGALKKLLNRSDPIGSVEQDMPTIFRVGRAELLKNTGNASTAATNALLEEYDRIIVQWPQIASKVEKPETMPALAEGVGEAISAAKQHVRDTNRALSDKILDVSNVYPDKLGGWWANLEIGASNLDLFGNRGMAGKAAKEMGLDGYSIEPKGTGFFLQKPVPINQTAPALRDFHAKLTSNMTPDSYANAFIGFLRSPEDTLSVWQNMNRKAAESGQSVILEYVKQQAKDIEALARLTIPGTKRKRMWDDFERVLNTARDIHITDPDLNPGGKPGWTFRNQGELEYHYMKTIGRLPEEAEVKAYFSIKRIFELDHSSRVWSVYTNKVRNGTLEHRYSFVNKAGERINSQPFEAVQMPEVPSGSKDIVAIIGDDGTMELKHMDQLGPRMDLIKDQVKTGWRQLSQIYDPDLFPLGTKESVRWVLSNKSGFKTKPLDWNAQLPQTGGGHFVHDYTHYVVMPDVLTQKVGTRTTNRYLGDVKAMPIHPVEGRLAVPKMNEAVDLIQKGDLAGARNIVENVLDSDWKEFYGAFVTTQKRDPKTGRMLPRERPRFSLNERFRLMEIGKTTMGTEGEAAFRAKYEVKGKSTFQDGTSSGSLANQFRTEFTQNRDAYDLYTLKNTGTIENPVFARERAKLLDAVPMMNRAMNKIANSNLMEAYKYNAVESWIREAAPLLAAKDSQLRTAPLYWFHHGEFRKGISKEDIEITRRLEVSRKQIQQFVGQVSDLDGQLHAVTQKLSDSLYGSKLSKVIDPDWVLHTLRDPTRLIRSFTFHKSMGFFSIPQLLVQGNTWINIAGIAGPVKAAQAIAAGMSHLWSTRNASPEFLAAMGKKMEAVGWRPGEWEEARESGLFSGFLNVGREYALRDDVMSNKVITTAWGKFLDWGALPFKWGETSVRTGAWYTAFKEFRDLNPTKALTNADRLSIHQRASLLNSNMTRSSNALYQKGWTSLPTQFLTYTIRQAELMWGKRLTPLEKARLLAVNATVYGVPTALGLTGLPSETFIRQNALENGYNLGDNYVSSMINEGIPSTLLALVNGGNYYNIPERFGTGGITKIDDMMRSDKTFLDIMGGAAYSSLKSMWDAGDAFKMAMMSMLSKDNVVYNVTPEHIAQIGKEITSINSSLRLYVALKTGQWMSKNELKLKTNVNPLEAVLMTVTGVQPQEVSDRALLHNVMEDEKATIKIAENKYILEFHRGLRAMENKDFDNGRKFFENAAAYMQLFIPDEDQNQLIKRAANDWETVIEKTKDDFAKHLPPELKNIRLQSYVKDLQLQQGKK